MNSSVRISPTLAGLRFVVSMAASMVAMVVEVKLARLAAAAVPSEHEPPAPVDPDRV
jgi:hypothetical protein